MTEAAFNRPTEATASPSGQGVGWFRRALDSHQLFFAIAEAVAHVNHGWRLGRLRRETGVDGRIRFSLMP